jgi:hypothetical protein
LPNKFKGGGGYFRVFAYDKKGKLTKILLFHWGTQEDKVRFMQQSWAYNATGDRYGPLWLDKKIRDGDMLSFKLPEEPLKDQILDVELNQLFDQLLDKSQSGQIDHITIAYGVWGRINMRGRKFTSSLNVEEINVTNNSMNEYPATVLLNGQALTKTDKELDYGYLYKKNKK